MKPPKQIIKASVPARIDVELISTTKELAKKSGYRFYSDFVDAALRSAVVNLNKIVK